jgi:TorA maturation chaperone TorD
MVARDGLLEGRLHKPEFSGTSEPAHVHGDLHRSHHYNMLAVLLSRAPDEDVLTALAALKGDATSFGLAHIALGESAAVADRDAVSREYFNLFVGVGRGELLPYGSFYQTGFLNEKPLARLRADLKALGIERVPGQTEPEDHIAILCEIIAALCAGRFGAAPGADRTMFERHLKPWAARFFADLEVAENARFYRHVGAVGRMFMELETDAFAWAA